MVRFFGDRAGGGFWQAVSYGNDWGMERETAGLVGEGLAQERARGFS